MSDYSIPEHT